MLRFVITLLLLAVLTNARADTSPTHCNGDEQIYFNCLLKDSKKVASVCGAGYKEESTEKNTWVSESGYLQYRFGPIGSVEFKYPLTTKNDGIKDRFNFSVTRTSNYAYYDMALQFSNDNYSYVLYFGKEHKYAETQIPGEIEQVENSSSSITVWKLTEPCLQSQCPSRAPHVQPEGKVIEVLTCSNRNAGENLISIERPIGLQTSPGKRPAVTLPYPDHGL